VYVTDILTDPIWDDYRDRHVALRIRSVWSRPLFTSEGKALGTFSINYHHITQPWRHRPAVDRECQPHHRDRDRAPHEGTGVAA